MSESQTECRAILANISAYLDGELQATACEAIEQHCQGCGSCAALVSGLRETVGLCRAAASTPLPEPVRQRARDSVRELLERESNTEVHRPGMSYSSVILPIDIESRRSRKDS
jgi:anti-sigma factor RsiW